MFCAPPQQPVSSAAACDLLRAHVCIRNTLGLLDLTASQRAAARHGRTASEQGSYFFS